MSATPAALVPPPPSSLVCGSYQLPSGTILHRIYDQRFTACSFNPGMGNSRFAPFEVDGKKVPTAYCATSLECAVFETLFHDIKADAHFKSVPGSSLEPLRYSKIELTRDVTLAPLFSADLMKLGLERNQLIDTPKSTYAATQVWSQAIHASEGAPEGLIWTSRRYDQEKALMFFGDRVSESSDLRLVETVGVATDAATLQVVAGLAQRAGILIAR